MGTIFSRFRKKVSTKEKLEKIQDEIKALEEYQSDTEQQRKKIVGSVIVSSLFLFFIAAIVCYIYYLPSTLERQLQFTTLFFGFLLVIYYLKRILTWYFRRKIRGNEKKLSSLNKEKEKILDQVMETETYKIAKEILETYAPETLRKSMPSFKSSPSQTPVAITKGMLPPPPNSEVRRRIVATPVQSSFRPQLVSPPQPGGRNFPSNTPLYPVPRPPITPYAGLQTTITNQEGVVVKTTAVPRSPPGPPMPRPVLPRERGVFDRLIEYLVGDGPSNRYALICRKCESHNGMALKDEFEYTAFRCAYCFHWNHARKQRPEAPKIENFVAKPLNLPPPTKKREDESKDSSSSEGEKSVLEEKKTVEIWEPNLFGESDLDSSESLDILDISGDENFRLEESSNSDSLSIEPIESEEERKNSLDHESSSTLEKTEEVKTVSITDNVSKSTDSESVAALPETEDSSSIAPCNETLSSESVPCDDDND